MQLTEKVVSTHYAFKPRIVVPKHPSRRLTEISFALIKGNRMLLFAKYLEKTTLRSYLPHLHLSIHEIRSDNRVGPALWSFNGCVDGHFNIYNLQLIKSTENALGINLGERFDNHWKLFDISTTETDSSDNIPLIESGRIDFDLKLKSNSAHGNSFGLSEISCSRVELALMCFPSTIP
jgi:hypothetical protein